MCADRLSYHPVYVSRIFRKETGMNFSEYLSRYRHTAARKLLAQTQLSVAEIAARVGFHNGPNFSRHFKKSKGLRPVIFANWCNRRQSGLPWNRTRFPILKGAKPMKGTKFSPEYREYKDKVSGRTIRQLTDYFTHSNHFYFTNHTFFQGDIIFKSQRGNSSNLYRLHMNSMVIEQLTDLPQTPLDDRFYDRMQHSCVHEGNEEAYMFYLGSICAAFAHFGASRTI